MKRILLLTIFVLVFCFEAFGQDCPTIKVIPPSKLPPEKGFMLFSVSIFGKIDTSKLEYNWSISQGNIFDGHGTTAITVPLDKNLEGEITATVKINGLPEGCKNTFSDSIMIPIKPQCRCVIDEYGKLRWFDEMIRLGTLITELRADSKTKGLIVFSFSNDAERQIVFNRQKKILQYFENMGVSSTRILMNFEKSKYYSTRTYIIPEGAELPIY